MSIIFWSDSRRPVPKTVDSNIKGNVTIFDSKWLRHSEGPHLVVAIWNRYRCMESGKLSASSYRALLGVSKNKYGISQLKPHLPLRAILLSTPGIQPPAAHEQPLALPTDSNKRVIRVHSQSWNHPKHVFFVSCSYPPMFATSTAFLTDRDGYMGPAAGPSLDIGLTSGELWTSCRLYC